MELECYGRRTCNQLCVDRRKYGQPVDLLSEQTHTIGISITRGNHRQAAPRPGAVPVPWLEQTLTRVKFKVTCLVCQSLSGQAPVYLADDCRLVSDSTRRRSLRSADVSTCVVPRTLSSYGHRTFAAAAPRLWNSLPVQLRNPDIT